MYALQSLFQFTIGLLAVIVIIESLYKTIVGIGSPLHQNTEQAIVLNLDLLNQLLLADRRLHMLVEEVAERLRTVNTQSAVVVVWTFRRSSTTQQHSVELHLVAIQSRDQLIAPTEEQRVVRWQIILVDLEDYFRCLIEELLVGHRDRIADFNESDIRVFRIIGRITQNRNLGLCVQRPCQHQKKRQKKHQLSYPLSEERVQQILSGVCHHFLHTLANYI